jgi:hypothetical protein
MSGIADRNLIAYSESGTGLLSLGLVNISNSLSHVEFGGILGSDTINDQHGVIGILVRLTLGVSSDNSLGVKSGGLSDGSLLHDGHDYRFFGLREP